MSITQEQVEFIPIETTDSDHRFQQWMRYCSEVQFARFEGLWYNLTPESHDLELHAPSQELAVIYHWPSLEWPKSPYGPSELECMMGAISVVLYAEELNRALLGALIGTELETE